MIFNRAVEFLKLLESCPYERVAVFTHNGFICATMRAVLGIGPEDGVFFTENCAISTFEYRDGKWRTGVWNYTGDLK